MLTLQSLTKELNLAVAQVGGVDKAMQACDRMYSATFRSEEFKLCEIEDFEDVVFNIKRALMISLYCKEKNVDYPVQRNTQCNCSHDCDCSSDAYMYECEAFDDSARYWFNTKYGELQLTGDEMVVDTCNYKGEFDNNYSLYELSKHLPIFKSKNDSFFQANS